MVQYEERIPQVKQQHPRRGSNRKLLVILLVFFIVVLTVIFIRSPYSKIAEIQVDGNDIYTKDEIIRASGIALGTQFFNVWESHVRENVKTLDAVQQITVTRDFPGVIQLHVKEYRRVAFWTTSDGNRFALLENGTLLKQVNFNNRVVDRPLISVWEFPELLPQLAKALSKLSPAIIGEISDIALTPTPYDKQRVTLYMRDGNEVHSVLYKLDKMLVWYPAILKEIPDGDKGVISMFERPWFKKYGEAEVPAEGDSEEHGVESTKQKDKQGQLNQQPQPENQTQKTFE